MLECPRVHHVQRITNFDDSQVAFEVVAGSHRRSHHMHLGPSGDLRRQAHNILPWLANAAPGQSLCEDWLDFRTAHLRDGGLRPDSHRKH